MSKRISGMSFDSYVDGDLIHIEKISLDITDNSAAAQTAPAPIRTAFTPSVVRKLQSLPRLGAEAPASACPAFDRSLNR